MTWTDVQNWLDLLDHVWIGLVLIACTVIPGIISARTNRGVKRIQDQVVNGHKDPLRKDLDRVIASLSDMGQKVDSISHSITNLRDELAEEEDRRRSSIRELREDFDKKFTDMLARFIR